MFYAHFVLAKKGPLSRIWLAAHWDKKLTKAHVYECNIEASVKDIMQPKVKMALRTSGHLLLGVVRIYSRKAKYLLADCNEAFVKIKMAFRPGMVDLPEDKREAAMNAITLPDVFHDFDTAMPELDDVDINAQFTLNQTRAEEITMREDYGNITLTTGDDGFGDSMGNSLEMEGPEIMRDASDNFGALGEEDMDMNEADKMREDSIAPSMAGDEAAPEEDKLDAPIRDDGFGGVGLVHDILSGGLFEGGSLFDDPMPGGSGSVRIPPSERTGFEDEDFPGMPSPVHSDGSGGGRPQTPPVDDEDQESLAGDSVMGDPSLGATPEHNSVPPSPAHSYRSVATLKDITGNPAHEQTTLLHNEEESFALAPVEASALKGERRKRKRKLIVDEVKAITGEGMKAQLSDSADIVTTLDIAPPTKRLMHWKETGGVEELFNLPGRKIRARFIVLDYQSNLKTNGLSPDELFVTLPSVHEREDDFQLENVGGGYQEEADVYSPKKRAPKRKAPEEKRENAYLKRQEELALQQEEFAAQQKILREQAAIEAEAEAEAELENERAETVRAEAEIEQPQPESENVSLPVPVPESPAMVPEGSFQPWAESPFPGTPGFDPAQSFGEVQPPFTPAHSGIGFDGVPSIGFPTPQHAMQTSAPSVSVREEYDNPDPVSYPNPPPEEPGQQASFTEQWVNQVQTTPGLMSPPQPGLMSPQHIHPPSSDAGVTNWEEMPVPDNVPVAPLVPLANPVPVAVPESEEEEEDEETVPEPQNGELDNRVQQQQPNVEQRFEEGDYENEEEEEEGQDMEEDETIEQFEDRVLNKRAAQLHRLMTRKFAERFSQMTVRNTRKQAAQKFHSLLVLQKMMAVETSQAEDRHYGEISISKGLTFDTAAKRL